MKTCEYFMLVRGKGQSCGEKALYKVSHPSKGGKMVAVKYACKDHMLEWKELPDVKIEEL